MNNKHLSFNYFSDMDYEEFIHDIPKYLLLKPIRNITAYKNNPRIRSFRDESIDEQFIQNLYLKEYRSEKKLLQTHLLTIIDKFFIKVELSNHEYDSLKTGTFTNEEFERVALKLLKTSKIKTKYIRKLLNIDDILFFKFESEERYRKKESEISELKNKMELLHEQNLDLQLEIKNYIDKTQTYKNMEVKNKLLEDEIRKLKDYTLSYDSIEDKDNKYEKNIEIEDVIKLIKKNMNHETYPLVLKTYENMHLDHMDLKEILDKSYEMKNNLVDEDEISRIKSIVFIEYILLSIKEIIKNG